jgi:hypothetical protein
MKRHGKVPNRFYWSAFIKKKSFYCFACSQTFPNLSSWCHLPSVKSYLPHQFGQANPLSLFSVDSIDELWLTQVSVAALLDNFITASSEMEMEEKVLQSKALVLDRLERNPMEPLLIKLARDFTDSQDLSDRLLKLYHVWTRTPAPHPDTSEMQNLYVKMQNLYLKMQRNVNYLVYALISCVEKVLSPRASSGNLEPYIDFNK